MSDTRAIVFDLDDTLYPLRAFVRSGFQAVARRVGYERRISPWLVLRELCRANQLVPGQELQHLCRRLGLPKSDVRRFVGIIRCHTPSLRLPAETVQVLTSLRSGWRIGVLTNGLPAIQHRKVTALGLPGHVDAIVMANECGEGRGKPDSAAFRTVLDRLGAAPERSVFVGDNFDVDVLGACRAGMHSIYLKNDGLRIRSVADRSAMHVDRLGAVPSVAEQLVGGGHRVGSF